MTASNAPITGVIWVTGYSAAGKTTVARQVVAQLRRSGVTPIFLDGDDLRAIFGNQFGYSRAERVELAKIYFRLCSHLAAQGMTVVISAIAMYDEVRAWLRANVPGSLEVFLDVPTDERKRRDAGTKKVYAQIGSGEDLYDAPTSADLVVPNHGVLKPSEAADRICAHFLAGGVAPARDRNRTAHWNSYYQTSAAPKNASTFAVEVAKRLGPSRRRVLEVGSGNGRDATFFAGEGHEVTAIDASAGAVEACRRDHARSGVTFVAGTLDGVAPSLSAGYDAVYSRFCLHAMTREEESAFIAGAQRLLATGGKLFIEARSINDPLARKGEILSPTERIHGHYRRFIVKEELLASLEGSGYRVLEQVESAGLAVHGDDDPVVIRVVAEKVGR